jgi:hypothetical protein
MITFAKAAAAVFACALYSGCAVTSWRATAPHNTPFAWEYNSRMEGFHALRDGWMRLTAPEGFEWDDLTQSYREVLQ